MEADYTEVRTKFLGMPAKVAVESVELSREVIEEILRREVIGTLAELYQPATVIGAPEPAGVEAEAADA
jgi:hypothetical protein